MQSWVLVFLMWTGSPNGGVSISTSPGIYDSEGACNLAAAKFNDQVRVISGAFAGGVCIPGPKMVLVPATKK